MKNEAENNPSNGEENFSLPEGYFQRSAASLTNRIEWIEEHKSFPALNAARKNNVFSLPEGYFQSSGERLGLLDNPLLASLQRLNSFSVPENYFADAEFTLLSRLLGDEDISLLPFQKQSPFTVKPGYFAENEQRLKTRLEQKNHGARVIRLFGSRTWMAAAALLLLALGFWLYRFYMTPASVKDCGTMACIDKQDLLKSKSIENLESDELYELVNSAQLEQELEKKSGGTLNTKQKDTTPVDVDDDLLDEI